MDNTKQDADPYFKEEQNEIEDDDELNNIEDQQLDTQLGVTVEDDDQNDNNPFKIDFIGENNSNRLKQFSSNSII